MLRVILILALFVSCASHAGILAQKSSTSEPSNPLSVITNSFVFTHPGTLNSDADFQTMKYQINNGIQPRSTFYSQLTSSTSCTTSYIDSPVSLMVNNTQADAFIKDASYAYCLAVRFAITGNQAYATHAEQILLDWSILQPPGTLGLNWYLNIAWTSKLYAQAADILAYYDHTWTPTAQLPVKKVMNNVFLPVMHKRYGMWNRGLIVADSLIAMGVYLEDPAALYEGVYRYLTYVPEYVFAASDGTLPNPLTVYNGWYSSTVGAYDPFDTQMMALHAGRLCSGCTDWITLSIPYQGNDPNSPAQNYGGIGWPVTVTSGTPGIFTLSSGITAQTATSVYVKADSGTLPGGFSAGTHYCMYSYNATSNTFSLALFDTANNGATCPGPAIAATSAGTNVTVSFNYGDDIGAITTPLQQNWSAPSGCGNDGQFIAIGSIINPGSGYSNGYNGNAVVTGGTGTGGTLNMTVGGTIVTTTTAAQASGTTISLASTNGMFAGYAITDTTTSAAIPSGTTIISVSGSTLTLSATVTGVLSGDTITVTVPSGVVSNVYGPGLGIGGGGQGYTVGDVLSTSSFGSGTGFQVAVTTVCQYAENFLPGYTQEYFRDLGHASSSYAYVEEIAETAWHQGIDVYTPTAQRLADFSEVMTYFLMGGTTNPIAYKGFNAHPVSAIAGFGEIVANHLINIMGYPTTGSCSMPTASDHTSMPCTALYLTSIERKLDPNLIKACPYTSPLPVASCPGTAPVGLGNPFATNMYNLCAYEVCFEPLTHGQLNGSLP